MDLGGWFGNLWGGDPQVLEAVADVGEKRLGFVLAALPPADPVVIQEVTPGLWAEAHGLAAGGHVLELNGEAVNSMDADGFCAALKERPLKVAFRPAGPPAATGDAAKEGAAEEGAAEGAGGGVPNGGPGGPEARGPTAGYDERDELGPGLAKVALSTWTQPEEPGPPAHVQRRARTRERLLEARLEFLVEEAEGSARALAAEEATVVASRAREATQEAELAELRGLRLAGGEAEAAAAGRSEAAAAERAERGALVRAGAEAAEQAGEQLRDQRPFAPDEAAAAAAAPRREEEREERLQALQAEFRLADQAFSSEEEVVSGMLRELKAEARSAGARTTEAEQDGRLQGLHAELDASGRALASEEAAVAALRSREARQEAAASALPAREAEVDARLREASEAAEDGSATRALKRALKDEEEFAASTLRAHKAEVDARLREAEEDGSALRRALQEEVASARAREEALADELQRTRAEFGELRTEKLAQADGSDDDTAELRGHLAVQAQEACGAHSSARAVERENANAWAVEEEASAALQELHAECEEVQRLRAAAAMPPAAAALAAAPRPSLGAAFLGGAPGPRRDEAPAAPLTAPPPAGPASAEPAQPAPPWPDAEDGSPTSAARRLVTEVAAKRARESERRLTADVWAHEQEASTALQELRAETEESRRALGALENHEKELARAQDEVASLMDTSGVAEKYGAQKAAFRQLEPWLEMQTFTARDCEPAPCDADRPPGGPRAGGAAGGAGAVAKRLRWQQLAVTDLRQQLAEVEAEAVDVAALAEARVAELSQSGARGDVRCCGPAPPGSAQVAAANGAHGLLAAALPAAPPAVPVWASAPAEAGWLRAHAEQLRQQLAQWRSLRARAALQSPAAAPPAPLAALAAAPSPRWSLGRRPRGFAPPGAPPPRPRAPQRLAELPPPAPPASLPLAALPPAAGGARGVAGSELEPRPPAASHSLWPLLSCVS